MDIKIQFPQTESNLVETGRVFTSFDEASLHLAMASIDAPKGGAYDKTWFRVDIAYRGEEFTYEGRIDLEADDPSTTDLMGHMRSHIAWLLGNDDARLDKHRERARVWDTLLDIAETRAEIDALAPRGTQLSLFS